MMGHRGLLEQEALKPRASGPTLKRLGGYFKKYWLVLLFVAALLGVNTYVQVITPEIIGQTVDCYITPAIFESTTGASGQAIDFMQQVGGETASQANCTLPALPAGSSAVDYIQALGRVALWLLGLFILGSITAGLMFYSMNWAGQHVLRALRTQVFDQLHRLSLGYYTRNEAGDLMSRITNDADTLQQAISFALIQVLSGVILLVWIMFNMFKLNFVYALLTLTVIPLMIIVTLWFSNRARRAFRLTRLEMGNVNAELQESISAVREVQAFNREGANIQSFRESNAANRDANIRAVSYTSALGPTLDALSYVAIAIVVGVGGLLMLRGGNIGGTAVSLGLIVTFLGYTQRLNQPIRQISVLWTNIQSAIAGAERLFDLLDVEPEITEMADAQVMPEIKGRVEFQNVFAEYNPGEPVCVGISLTAEPGQTVAIVGPTGAGKTTIINLIPRFYDVTSGSVRIDGIDVRDVTLASLRSQIGIVLQDTFLFSDTVMENIRFGRPEASDDEVIAAAKLAHADSFIDRLPDGYQTVLGERGSGLSLGQRQLLAIARAALSNPGILILDEATSSVDTRTERQIQAALNELLAGRTSFVIAHRLSTIRNADQVLVLDKGQIVERGKHDELLAAKGFYYDLYMSQFRREEEPEPAFSGNGAQKPATAKVTAA
ncbi:MAG: ABC transporter ATP-binding protein [Caldilineales bacterium]|nr:ABC transporter ATP-binding protein [Caldilineales bacterium]